jgi:hypothetical protein
MSFCAMAEDIVYNANVSLVHRARNSHWLKIRRLMRLAQSRLCRVCAARARTFTEGFLAFLVRDRPAADDRCQEIIGDGLRFALLQRRARGQGRRLRAQIRLRQAVAALIGVGELVIMGHWRCRPAAHDHLDQLLPVHPALAQVRGAAIGLRLPCPVGGPAVAERALRLVEIKPAAIAAHALPAATP